ncbi:MAG: symmetrical bis(5'-nucleosyl)-tetraphosphatase [Gammaproteobacteria bacterium]
MAVYAIGDVQGCLQPLRDLLDAINFDPDGDRLWFVGDLVNRGPDSLGTLRFVRGLGDSAVTVLGNHDLHLLAMAHGNQRHNKADPGMQAIIDAPDAEELLTWLRHRPVLHVDEGLGMAMVHAGIPPGWDLDTARAEAQRLEACLRSDSRHAFFAAMYGNKPDLWDESLAGMERLRFTTNAFTRMRYCTPQGAMEHKVKLNPGETVEGLIPWFRHPRRTHWPVTVVFGHWSTLGYVHHQNTYAIDTGCVWGGTLTALRIDPERTRAQRINAERRDHETRRFSLRCPQSRAPG